MAEKPGRQFHIRTVTLGKTRLSKSKPCKLRIVARRQDGEEGAYAPPTARREVTQSIHDWPIFSILKVSSTLQIFQFGGNLQCW